MKIATLVVRLFILHSLLIAASSFADDHVIGLVPPASNELQQGFIRITNQFLVTSGEVTVYGVDDAGNLSQGEIRFMLEPQESKHMNSDDLEFGNSDKGLTGALGDGEGNWRIHISSGLLLKTMGFIRTPQGFMTSMHSVTESSYGLIHSVDVFNPASNVNQVSRVRITNMNGASNDVVITGIDDSGNTPGEDVTLTIAPWATIELTSQDLENGNADKGLVGALGNGVGKWRLSISTLFRSTVMSLLEASGGYLSNLSPSQRSEDNRTFFDLTCSDIDGASIFSQEDEPKYLGFFGSDFASDSVNNDFGTYGSDFSQDSVRDDFSDYGSSFSRYSAFDDFALDPPVVVKNGKTLFYLSTNRFVSTAVYSLTTIDDSCTFTSFSKSETFALPN